MKLFCYFQAVALVSAGPAFGSRGERCQNVIDFFKRDRVIRNDSKLMQKMVAKADNFIGVMRHAEASCKESMGRNVADFDDDVDRTVNESNVFDKIEACYDRFSNYIDQKIPADLCPNSHARITRVLGRMNGTMRKAAEARTKRVLSSSLRSNQTGDIVKGMSKEDQAAKQELKSDKRDTKEANGAVVAESQAEKLVKQSNKAAGREMKQAKSEMKADNQAEKAVKKEEKVEKQEGKVVKKDAKADKRDRKAEKPLKEKDGKDKDGKDKDNKKGEDENLDEAL